MALDSYMLVMGHLKAEGRTGSYIIRNESTDQYYKENEEILTFLK